MGEGDDDWVFLKKCAGQPEAQVLRGCLEAEGIEVEFQDDSSNSLMMFLGTSTEIRVFVPRRSLEQAEAILAGEGDEVGTDESAREPGVPEQEPDEPDAPEDRKLWLGAVIGLAVVGLSLGFGQIYVGRPKLGMVMLAVAAVSLYCWWVLDNALAGGVFLDIWAADWLFASWTIIVRNREIENRKQARLAQAAQLAQAASRLPDA